MDHVRYRSEFIEMQPAKAKGAHPCVVSEDGLHAEIFPERVREISALPHGPGDAAKFLMHFLQAGAASTPGGCKVTAPMVTHEVDPLENSFEDLTVWPQFSLWSQEIALSPAPLSGFFQRNHPASLDPQPVSFTIKCEEFFFLKVFASFQRMMCMGFESKLSWCSRQESHLRPTDS